MLSYRHSFHAGNYADVLKHTIWLFCLQYMQSKDKPLRIIDTHAGAGAYTLSNDHPKHRAEYLDGIARLYGREDLPATLADYIRQIRDFNSGGQLTRYPGSPLLTQACLRAQDTAWFYELHSSDSRLLQRNLGQHRRIHVRNEDGFTGLKSLLPPTERRALVLMDPSYEIKTDYSRVAEAVKDAHRRFGAATLALWYPVVNRTTTDILERQLARSGIPGIQLFELGTEPDTHGHGMTASGMILINPPWTLWQAMEPVLPWLAQALSKTGEGHYHRQERLTPEQ